MEREAAKSIVTPKFGSLVVDRMLGRGMAGEVFLARNPASAQSYVVKRLRAHTTGLVDLARFAREATVMRRLRHPNLMPVLYVSVGVNPPFYIMPYRSGLTVAERLAQGRLPVALAARIARDACSGLAEAHRLGIVHRDVKPGNLLLEPNGRTVVLDFGLAKDLESVEALTGQGTLLGTPGYMAPEQCQGNRVDARTDVYSLGVTFYELVLGKNPFASSDLVETLRRQLEETPRRLDALLPHKVDAELGELVHRMIAKSPEHRPSTETCLEAFSAIARRLDDDARAATRCVRRPNELVA